MIPAGVGFQVEYPTPLASISAYIVPGQQQALLGSYERAMFADPDRLLGAIPGDDVAVQWDVAVEFGILEEAFAPGGAQAFDAIVAALARCIDQVPAGMLSGWPVLVVQFVTRGGGAGAWRDHDRDRGRARRAGTGYLP